MIDSFLFLCYTDMNVFLERKPKGHRKRYEMDIT